MLHVYIMQITHFFLKTKTYSKTWTSIPLVHVLNENVEFDYIYYHQYHIIHIYNAMQYSIINL